jgi:hypothetical protein
MASASGENEDQVEGAHEPRECMPCRGSGQVISNLGGAPSKIDCPWCGGGRIRVPGSDAQARWPVEDASGAQAQDGSDAATAPVS